MGTPYVLAGIWGCEYLGCVIGLQLLGRLHYSVYIPALDVCG